MPRTSTADRMERLDLMTARLASDEPMTLAALAVEMGVSVRTLMRDIEALRARGVPVETERGRGGGVRLAARWAAGRIALSYAEALDLMVSLAIAERMPAPVLMANLAPVRRKLVASLPPALRDRVAGLKQRILIGRSASPFVMAGFAAPDAGVVARLNEAFVEERVLRIRYRAADGTESARRIEPHCLGLNYPVWYALSWDREREAVRTFRCDRIIAAFVSAERFARRPLEPFRAAMEDPGLTTP